MSRYYISNSRIHADLNFDLEKILCQKIQRLPITMSDLGTVSNDQEASAQRDNGNELLRILHSPPSPPAESRHCTPVTIRKRLELPRDPSLFSPIENSWQELKFDVGVSLEGSQYVLNQKYLYEKNIRLHGQEAFEPPFCKDTGILFPYVITLRVFKDNGGMFVARSSQFNEKNIKLKGREAKKLPASEIFLPVDEVNIQSASSIAHDPLLNIEAIQDLLNVFKTTVQSGEIASNPLSEVTAQTCLMESGPCALDCFEPLTPDHVDGSNGFPYDGNNEFSDFMDGFNPFGSDCHNMSLAEYDAKISGGDKSEKTDTFCVSPLLSGKAFSPILSPSQLSPFKNFVGPSGSPAHVCVPVWMNSQQSPHKTLPPVPRKLIFGTPQMSFEEALQQSSGTTSSTVQEKSTTPENPPGSFAAILHDSVYSKGYGKKKPEFVQCYLIEPGSTNPGSSNPEPVKPASVDQEPTIQIERVAIDGIPCRRISTEWRGEKTYELVVEESYYKRSAERYIGEQKGWTFYRYHETNAYYYRTFIRLSDPSVKLNNYKFMEDSYNGTGLYFSSRQCKGMNKLLYEKDIVSFLMLIGRDYDRLQCEKQKSDFILTTIGPFKEMGQARNFVRKQITVREYYDIAPSWDEMDFYYIVTEDGNSAVFSVERYQQMQRIISVCDTMATSMGFGILENVPVMQRWSRRLIPATATPAVETQEGSSKRQPLGGLKRKSSQLNQSQNHSTSGSNGGRKSYKSGQESVLSETSALKQAEKKRKEYMRNGESENSAEESENEESSESEFLNAYGSFCDDDEEEADEDEEEDFERVIEYGTEKVPFSVLKDFLRHDRESNTKSKGSSKKGAKSQSSRPTSRKVAQSNGKTQSKVKAKVEKPQPRVKSQARRL